MPTLRIYLVAYPDLIQSMPELTEKPNRKKKNARKKKVREEKKERKKNEKKEQENLLVLHAGNLSIFRASINSSPIAVQGPKIDPP